MQNPCRLTDNLRYFIWEGEHIVLTGYGTNSPVCTVLKRSSTKWCKQRLEPINKLLCRCLSIKECLFIPKLLFAKGVSQDDDSRAVCSGQDSHFPIREYAIDFLVIGLVVLFQAIFTHRDRLNYLFSCFNFSCICLWNK